MARKIIDIRTTNKKDSLKKRGYSSKKSTEEKKQSHNLLYLAGIIFLILFFSFVFISLNPKAEIEIFPSFSEITVEDSFEAQTSTIFPDLDKKIIPARLIEKSIQKSKKFFTQSTILKKEKAKGKIKLYNNLTRSITLRASTRFLSSEGGKIFRTPKAVSLPPAVYQGNKLVPGTIEIEVVAEETGEDYNIGPSKFSVPGLAGTALYYKIYGESENPMSGGFEKEVKVVKEEDIKKAKNVLKESALQELKRQIKTEVPKDFILVEETVFEKEEKIECDAKENEEKEYFSCVINLSAEGISFKKSDLESLALKILQPLVSSSQKLIKESITFSYLHPQVLPEKGRLISGLEIKARVYQKINTQVFAERIASMTKQEVSGFIQKEYPHIQRIQIRIRPFWIKKLPKNPERIKIIISTDQSQQKS